MRPLFFCVTLRGRSRPACCATLAAAGPCATGGSRNGPSEPRAGSDPGTDQRGKRNEEDREQEDAGEDDEDAGEDRTNERGPEPATRNGRTAGEAGPATASESRAQNAPAAGAPPAGPTGQAPKHAREAPAPHGSTQKRQQQPETRQHTRTRPTNQGDPGRSRGQKPARQASRHEGRSRRSQEKRAKSHRLSFFLSVRVGVKAAGARIEPKKAGEEKKKKEKRKKKDGTEKECGSKKRASHGKCKGMEIAK